MADPKRFELLTSGSANRRSILLNYGSVCNKGRHLVRNCSVSGLMQRYLELTIHNLYYFYSICSLNRIVKCFGHLGRIRTGIHGVAVRCIAILPLGVGRGGRIRTYDLLVPNQAPYQTRPHPVAQVEGIEPSFSVLETDVLPLHYTHKKSP